MNRPSFVPYHETLPAEIIKKEHQEESLPDEDFHLLILKMCHNELAKVTIQPKTGDNRISDKSMAKQILRDVILNFSLSCFPILSKLE